MGAAVGIDLGTSNSCVAVVKDGKPLVLTDPEGRRTQPSVVAFGYNRSVVVGYRARKQTLYAPDSTIGSAKRLLGRKYLSEEVQWLKAHSAFGVTEGDNGDVRIRVQGVVYTPEEMAGHVLRHMKVLAEGALQEEVDRAVITVPAYFNDLQRAATRQAAELAGLECLRVLNEPTAAALAYGYGKGQRQKVAVYDLGGGTFDISVLRIDDDLFEVVSTAGDTFLGGDDFDYAAADQFLSMLERDVGANLQEQRIVRLRLRDAAEQAKIGLSTAQEVEVHVPAAYRTPSGEDFEFRTRVNRFVYASWTLPLVKKTFETCDEALRNASMTIRQLDDVLLVGGMTRYPMVRDAVEKYFGRIPSAAVNPDEAVAIGAAIQAWNLTNDTSSGPGSILLDVTPQTLSVRTLGGFCDLLIPRNTPVPTEALEGLPHRLRPADGGTDRRLPGRVQAGRGERAARRVRHGGPPPPARPTEGPGDLRAGRRRDPARTRHRRPAQARTVDPRRGPRGDAPRGAGRGARAREGRRRWGRVAPWTPGSAPASRSRPCTSSSPSSTTTGSSASPRPARKPTSTPPCAPRVGACTRTGWPRAAPPTSAAGPTTTSSS